MSPIDFADEAQAVAEKHLEEVLRSRKILTLPFSGFCISCNEPLVERRYCDAFCRDNHEAQLKRKL